MVDSNTVFYSNSIIDKKYPYLNPVQFGYRNCVKSHFCGPMIRTYWIIHYVVSGKGIFKINNKVYTLKKGDMFVIPPYIETYYEADAEKPWSYIWIGFTCDGNLPANLTDTIHLPKAIQIFESMKFCSQLENGKTEFLCSKLWELFSMIMDFQSEKTDYIECALNLIHIEYMNGITVKDVADRLNLERTYFSALFKRKTGISPSKYLNDYRMKLAKDFIINKKLSITVTAYSVGYTDIYTFSKSFKKHFGLSPRKYIEQKTKKQVTK